MNILDMPSTKLNLSSLCRAISRHRELALPNRAVTLSLNDYFTELPTDAWGLYLSCLYTIHALRMRRLAKTLQARVVVEVQMPLCHWKKDILSSIDVIECCTWRSIPSLLIYNEDECGDWREELLLSKRVECALAEELGVQVDVCATEYSQFLLISGISTVPGTLLEGGSVQDGASIGGEDNWYIDLLLQDLLENFSEQWSRVRLPRLGIERALFWRYPGQVFDDQLWCVKGRRQISAQSLQELANLRDAAMGLHRYRIEQGGHVCATAKTLLKSHDLIDFPSLNYSLQYMETHEDLDLDQFGFQNGRTPLITSHAILELLEGVRTKIFVTREGCELALMIRLGDSVVDAVEKCATPFLFSSTPPSVFWWQRNRGTGWREGSLKLKGLDGNIQSVSALRCPREDAAEENGVGQTFIVPLNKQPLGD